MLRWSATAAARLSSTATQLEPVEQEIKPVEQEINPSFNVDTYDTCELSEGNYTLSNLSEIWCASGNSGKSLKNIIEMHPNSSKKLVLEPTKPLRLVGKGEEQTTLDFDISLLPGANLSLKDLRLKGRIEVLEDETSSGQSKMSYLTFVNCTVEAQAHDAKQLALAELELEGGIQDPLAWRGWLMLRDAALTLQIHDSSLYGGAFVKQSPTFNLSASKSSFYSEDQGFQLVNVTSHIRLEEVQVWSQGSHPSFKMLSGRHEIHVAGSTFYGSAIEILDSLDLILDVSNTQFTYGRSAIVVTGHEGHGSRVDLQDVKISGVSISGCSVAVVCNHCASWSLEDVLIAGNAQALESYDGTYLQTSISGLVFFNSWRDTLAINQGKGANVLVWSRLPCPIAIAFSCLACGLATILSRIGLEQHFSGGFETSGYGQTRKYVLGGASFLLWIMVVEAVVAAFLLRTMSWTYEHQRQVHLKIVKFYATIWLTFLLAVLAGSIVYLYITVVRRRLDIKTLADLKRTEMLLQQKDRSTEILLEFP